jgi:hypothetical protein
VRSAAFGLCISLLGSSALAAAKKPDLSADFAHAAVKYLMVVGSYESAAAESPSKAQERIGAAYEEMASAASGDKISPENLTVLSLKIFAVTHVMNVKTYQLSGDGTEVTKDDLCITDWKQSLQARSSNQPATCK